VLYLPDDAVNIFTDGSSKPKPRRGGVGFRIIVTGEDGHEKVYDESPNGYPGATNNEMELQACIEGLAFLRSGRCPIDLADFRKVVIYTDSAYVHNNVGTAISQWSRSRWMRGGGPPVLNARLWQGLIRAMKRTPIPVHIEWVPGKSSHHTKAVDRLAKDSADRPYGRAVAGGVVRRKRSAQQTDPGIVPMEGQIADVYIVESQYLSTQRCSRYRYKIQGGDLDGALDWAFSDLQLRPAHAYRVRFNENPSYPQIVERLDEVAVI
jgi:ribonuclease HI